MTPTLATGFVSDTALEGTTYPSAGGNSADPNVQAIYWRCIVVFFYSARYTNPDLKLALYSNIAPPIVDDLDIAALLQRIGVELRQLPLNARLPREKAAYWGNVLYFLDVFDDFAATNPDGALALTDSDLVITGDISDLFALLDSAQFAGYRVDTPPDRIINGMSPAMMAKAASEIDGHDHGDAIPHFGGELLLAAARAWSGHQAIMRRLFEHAQVGEGAAGLIRTEEHIYSIAFALMDEAPATANRMLRRIWTSPRHNTVQAGDEDFPMWHLPAEKRYGFADLFSDLKRLAFPLAMSPETFRSIALNRCGLPKKSIAKRSRDMVRQLSNKVGVFK